MTAILKILKYQTQLQFDLRYEISLYIHVMESLAPEASCKGNVSSINANIVIVFLGHRCQKKISMNNREIAGQGSMSQAYWVTLAVKRL